MQDQVKIYENFPLPVILCDTDFQVFWCNKNTKSFPPYLTEPQGMRILLAELDLEEVKQKLLETGNYQIAGIFPFSEVFTSISPILKDNSLIGVAVMFLLSETTASPLDTDYISKVVRVLVDNVRMTLNDIFAIGDVLTLKAELLHAPWIFPHFNKTGMHCYQILRLVNNVSFYSKWQNQELIPHFTTFNLYDWLRKIQPAVLSLGEKMEIPIEFHIPEEDLYLALDVDWFQNAFFNVLHNSMYFTKAENHIEISAYTENDEVKLSITDKGLGIDETILPSVLKPYFSYAPLGEKSNVGLGLAIVARIMDAHKGRIEIDSVVEQGTSVTFHIPHNTFSQNLSLSQKEELTTLHDRFSPLYVGLTSALITPYQKK